MSLTSTMMIKILAKNQFQKENSKFFKRIYVKKMRTNSHLKIMITNKMVIDSIEITTCMSHF